MNITLLILNYEIANQLQKLVNKIQLINKERPIGLNGYLIGIQFYTKVIE